MSRAPRRRKCGCVTEYMHVDYEWRGPVWAVTHPCSRHDGSKYAAEDEAAVPIQARAETP